MLGANFRDLVEYLLGHRDEALRRIALETLCKENTPLSLEVLRIARDLVGSQGDLAERIIIAAGIMEAALGPKCSQMADDPNIAPFCVAGSPYRPLALQSIHGDARTYLAVQVGLRRLVWLKVLLARFACVPAAREHFLDEAHLVGRLNHRFMASILDAGAFRDRPFVAMEALEGPVLRQLVAFGGALAWPRAARLLREVATVLAAGGRLGIPHGEISSLMIHLDRDDHLKLTGFAPLGAHEGQEALQHDLECLGLLFHEMLNGEILPRVPVTGPPPLPAVVPHALAAVGKELLAGRFPGFEELIERLDGAISASQEALAVRPAGTQDGFAHAPQRLLILDHSPEIQETVKNLMRSLGFEVECATALEEAWSRLSRTKYALILADLAFPGPATGLSLLEFLVSACAGVPLVIMTANPEVEYWDSLLQQGATAVLAKPLDETETIAVVGRSLSGRRPDLLLIDDSLLARQVFRKYFENRGFAVKAVGSVSEARSEIDRAEPEVIVCDLLLEDGTGLDVLEYLHTNKLDARTILMSARPDTDSVIRAHRLDVYDFVNKSEDLRHLLQSVERVLLERNVRAHG